MRAVAECGCPLLFKKNPYMTSLREYINKFEPWYKQHPYLLVTGILVAVGILVGIVLASMPRQPKDLPTAEEIARRDSAALHVALMPVHDCLPFYVAEQLGYYDSLGLDLRILTLQAQLDTDTALLRRRAELVYSDLARAIMIQQTDTSDLRVIATCEGRLRLLTAYRGRVRQIRQLKERMVAVARHSITDYWSDRLMDTASMAQTDIFRPQINNVRVRTDMLCNGTMDAALLPEPYATEAQLRGNKVNFSTKKLKPQLAALVVPAQVISESSRVHQIALLLKGYQLACEKMNAQQADCLPELLRSLCSVPDTLIDSVCHTLPSFQSLLPPQQADAEAALVWLRGRGKVRKSYHIDSLFYTPQDTTLWILKLSGR